MYPWIFACGIIFAFYNAWGIGANDCANSFATSVGAKVLTLRNAVIIASIFEFSGAVLMGSHVTDMVRKKIVSQDIFENNPGALMFGMLCADLSSAIWLTVATYFKLPVSTTHSIIGAIVGFSLAYNGTEAVNWDKVGLVVASWVISPLLAGLFSLTIFYLLNTLIFKKENPVNNIIMLFPILTFLTFFINSLFIIYKGSPQLKLDELPFWICFLISLGISTVTALLARYIYVPYVKNKISLGNNLDENNLEEQNNTDNELEVFENDNENNDGNDNQLVHRTKSYIAAKNNTEDTKTDDSEVNGAEVNDAEVNDAEVNDAEVNDAEVNDAEVNDAEVNDAEVNDAEVNDNNDFKFDSSTSISDNILRSRKHVEKLENIKLEKEIEELHENADKINPKADELCSWIQIITACFSSFAHGSNDVANAIAPLATIYHIYRYNDITKKTDVPIWILLIGGFGIVVGLATWGYKIINRMGREITKISPSRGFIIELSAALTVIIASRAEIPVSTTHCQVGSIVGCGLVGGLKNIKWSLLKNIVISWLVTLPVTGLLSATMFSYGYYSPNDSDIIIPTNSTV